MERMRLNRLFFFGAIFLLSGCLKDLDNSAKLTINLTIPSKVTVDIDITDIEIKLQNKNNSFLYTQHPDKNGKVEFNVQPGKYDILASAYYEDSRVAVNGAVTEFLLSEEGIVSQSGEIVPPFVEILLNVAEPSPLVIREMYYHGSSTFEGKSYTKDTYIEIYNNSGPTGKVQYLDSLCLASIAPANSTASNSAWLGKDTIAIFQMFWMFPGDGQSHPLKPGESAVVAVKAAVDHSTRATSTLELQKAHFGCYNDALSGHEIAAGVDRMELFMAGQGTAWALSIHSPAVVLFKPEMGVKKYRDDSATWERFEPGTTSGTKYWHISKEWILDGVECADKPEGALKRLPTDVDASYVIMRSSHYSGKCVTRKLHGVFNGIEVFKDTNNSAEDFTPDSPLSPRLRK